MVEPVEEGVIAGGAGDRAGVVMPSSAPGNAGGWTIGVPAVAAGLLKLDGLNWPLPNGVSAPGG
jgi:hypothetical protein